jgi:hypothetical protein
MEVCNARADDQKKDCLTDPIRLQDQQASLTAALARAQAKQVAAATARNAIKALPPAGDYIYIYVLSPSPDHKTTVTITAKDAISGDATALGTVVMTWQGSNFSISTGLLISTMRNRTYANDPVIVNCAPVTTTTTSTGTPITTTNTIVTESDTQPSFVTPLVFVNYEFTSWCSGKCGFLASGGIGANLTTTTADFAAGPSFRYKEAIFTRSLHIGRETFPANGITVGDTQLPETVTTVPTEMEFRFRGHLPHSHSIAPPKIHLP